MKLKPLIKDRLYKGFIYRITTDEDFVLVGDYIFDFVAHTLGNSPVFRCDTDHFAELINIEHQKPIAQRRSAKIIASSDPVLNAHGIAEL